MLNIKDILNASLPFYEGLQSSEKDLLINYCIVKHYTKDSHIIDTTSECSGLIIVIRGQIRAYSISNEGKEITLYRLIEGDSCIMSASCMLKDINFSVSLEFESDTDIIIIPTNIYNKLNDIASVKNYTLNLVSSRFTDVMWVLEQYVFTSLAKRLANTLLERMKLIESEVVSVTHEELANDLGSAREVITRLLKQFEEDGLVLLRRRNIEIIDELRLSKI